MSRRPIVERFADEMEFRLAKNDWKGGWMDTTPAVLLNRLAEEVGELSTAVRLDGDDINGEAADVANFAMMIAQRCGGLRAPAASPAAPPEEK